MYASSTTDCQCEKQAQSYRDRHTIQTHSPTVDSMLALVDEDKYCNKLRRILKKQAEPCCIHDSTKNNTHIHNPPTCVLVLVAQQGGQHGALYGHTPRVEQALVGSHPHTVLQHLCATDSCRQLQIQTITDDITVSIDGLAELLVLLLLIRRTSAAAVGAAAASTSAAAET